MLLLSYESQSGFGSFLRSAGLSSLPTVLKCLFFVFLVSVFENSNGVACVALYDPGDALCFCYQSAAFRPLRKVENCLQHIVMLSFHFRVFVCIGQALHCLAIWKRDLVCSEHNMGQVGSVETYLGVNWLPVVKYLKLKATFRDVF